MLTCQILIRDDVDKIYRAISSLRPLNPEFLVIDVGSHDGTKEYCLQQGIRVHNIGQVSDYSSLRNSLIYEAKYDWNLMLHPWEIIDDIAAIERLLQGNPKVYSLPILNGSAIIHEPRLWHRSINCRFINPVFETLKSPVRITPASVMVLSDGQWIPNLSEIQKWKASRPISSEPVYYEACYHLAKNEWNEFFACSTRYLFNNNLMTQPVITIKYRMALILCHIKRDANAAIKHIMECLIAKPLMAEYWCLLGDIYYHLLSHYTHASRFYRNAIILGSRRKDDAWPIEIAKYRDYPEKMISSCEKLLRCHSVVKI